MVFYKPNKYQVIVQNILSMISFYENNAKLYYFLSDKTILFRYITLINMRYQLSIYTSEAENIVYKYLCNQQMKL